MKKGTGPYWRKRVSPAMEVLLKFLESLGIDTTGIIISDNNEKFFADASRSRGRFLQKESPGRRRQEGGKRE